METNNVLFVEWILIIQLAFCILSVVRCNEICEIHATVIRRIENEGFHRDIHSLVEIVTGYFTLLDDCVMILEETMPSGLYVNPDQLADMRRFRQVQACPVGMVDIEASQKDSLPHSVYVYSSLNRTENLLSASLTLPFHVRYHSPTPHGGYSMVQLAAPSLLLHCQNDMQCVQGKRIHAPCRPCGSDLCQWVNLTYKT
ncbi:phosphatidylinositol-glycan biosynthesis class X protein isoform X2 [Zootermopsis nevadensis]|nr:phosphatidylinositol-glycan biosynthesis class X protein isoform X2 [Zootermopsis nevadensis]